VAELAGVGATWYTWLEQARDIRPSERTLRRIARALQLTKMETKYLLDLALEHAPRRNGDMPVAPEMLLIVNAMSTPAFVLGHSGNLLTYNAPANALYDFDYAPDHNYMKTVFGPESRALIANWADYAMHLVAVFRTRSAGVLGDPDVANLVAELSESSSEFRQWWEEQAVAEVHAFQYICDHPFAGSLNFDVVCFGVVEYPDLSVIALATEQTETRGRLAELVRQLENGEHDAKHNVWTALVAKYLTPVSDAYHRQYQ
jgi:hypothetical protein